MMLEVLMPDEFRHPAPPFYRSSRPGKANSHRHRVRPAEKGKSTSNMSVPPIVHTDGKGGRVLFEERSVQVTSLNPDPETK